MLRGKERNEKPENDYLETAADSKQAAVLLTLIVVSNLIEQRCYPTDI